MLGEQAHFTCVCLCVGLCLCARALWVNRHAILCVCWVNRHTLCVCVCALGEQARYTVCVLGEQAREATWHTSGCGRGSAHVRVRV